jgi:outer membrane protein assembly factor BamB
MSSLNPTILSRPRLQTAVLALSAILSIPFAACTKVTKGEADPKVTAPPSKPQPVPVRTWLGNPERNFFGSGPWKEGELSVAWEVKTGLISGRLHKDGWGGTSWPGQPAVEGELVYFPAADGTLYALKRSDGSTVWSFKGKDSFKATPTIAGDKILASGLDHHVYCLDAKDGKPIWDYQTGFEVDGAAAVIGDRVYFGSEDHNFYCLNLADGNLIYKTLVGSIEGSVTSKGDQIFLGTEEGDLYCLNAADGSVIWKARIGADSDSTPALSEGLVYTAAEDGVVRAYDQATGVLVWHYVTEGSRMYVGNEKRGIWASPIVYKKKVYIGTSNGYMHCLSADKGELIWRYKAHGAIWGSSPVVDNRLVFGDKAGWLNMVSTEDGKLISEIKIGENINSTPAVMDGEIYIGAFMGNLFKLQLKPKPPAPEAKPTRATAPGIKRHKPKIRKKKPTGLDPAQAQPISPTP